MLMINYSTNSIIKRILLTLSSVVWMYLLNSSSELYSQDAGKYIKVGGSINLSDNFYSSSGIDRRQPANVARGIFRTTFTILDEIQLPFELYLSSQERKFQQPFNQFGVSPRISNWLTLHAGYFSSKISDYTFGDLRMLGGGFELTPGKFRLKALYGRSKIATEGSSVNNYPAVYKQIAYAASIGYGGEGGTYFSLNLFHAKDDTSSIKNDSLALPPAENLVGALRFGSQIVEALNIQSEVAVSAYSSNIKAERIKDLSFPEFFFTPNASSRVDGAAKIQITLKPSNLWSLRFNAQWIGPGFNTLGYSLMTNDLMEFSLSPSMRLLENKLTLRLQAGVRYNNLRNNRISKTSRFTGSFNASWQVSQAFGLDLNFNNNQITSGHKNDTLRLSNVFNSFMLSPRFTFEALGGNNSLNLNYSYQNSIDKNIITSQASANKTHSAGVVHTLSLPSTLNFTTSINFNRSITSLIKPQILSISENVGRRFLNNNLNISLGGGINFIKAASNDSHIFFNLNTNYSFGKYGNLGFVLTNNNYNTDSEFTKSFKELYGSLQYNIAF